jgi:hypothetical protein
VAVEAPVGYIYPATLAGWAGGALALGWEPGAEREIGRRRRRERRAEWKEGRGQARERERSESVWGCLDGAMGYGNLGLVLHADRRTSQNSAQAQISFTIYRHGDGVGVGAAEEAS